MVGASLRRGPLFLNMAFICTTITVTDLSFATVGSEVEWTVTGLEGLDEISTIVSGKNPDKGEVELMYDDSVLPEGIDSIAQCQLSDPVVQDECGFLTLLKSPVLTVSAGRIPHRQERWRDYAHHERHTPFLQRHYYD